jgi:outer membrane protein OmpA-like peptidoglycan-associated protein
MTRGVCVLAAVCLVCIPVTVPIAAAQAPPQSQSVCSPPKDAAFGTAKKMDVSMEGKIYFLPQDADDLPDFSKLKSEGSIYTDRWNVPARDFTSGFPGVTNRYEWFALDYQGSIYVPAAGEYGFHLSSDDGSRLYLDDRLVVDNGGVHSMADSTGSATLTQGDHKFRLTYFQGPATALGLVLFVTPPGGSETLFRLQDFNKAVLANRKLLGVSEDEKEIRIRFGAEVLFDTGKYDLKPAAEDSLKQLASVLRAYPGREIIIEGHTDNVGTAASNQVLSENRAKSVKDWLVSNGHVAAVCMSTKGYGATQPVAPNTTPDGRQKNRRVEVKIEKGEGEGGSGGTR